MPPIPSILLIRNSFSSAIPGGREMLCQLNHDCLREIFGEKLTVVELKTNRVKTWKATLDALQGNIDGVDSHKIDEIAGIISEHGIKAVFIDGSNLGAVAAGLRKRVGGLRIVTFFHNVESRFFWGSLRSLPSARALIVLLSNFVAERQAVKHSDELVAMTTLDSETLKKLYGRPATAIFPMALRDQLPDAEAAVVNDIPRPVEPYLLFVGGSFYGNKLGIKWFIQNVAPRINIKTVVIGRGMEALASELQASKNVDIVGGVRNLQEWYTAAALVLAPIFDGSGMKTKVAEALMFGKKVAGTRHAFCGYEDVADQAGWVCDSADDFVKLISSMEGVSLPSFDPNIRALYEEKFSYEAAKTRLSNLFTVP